MVAPHEECSDLVKFYKNRLADLMLEAIINEDSAFFRRMESAVKCEPCITAGVPEWEDCVFKAFIELLGEMGRAIKKIDVQKRAKRLRAVNSPHTNGYDPEWTRIFKRCGLADLEKNKGGRKPAKQPQKLKKTVRTKPSATADSLKS